MPQGFWIEEYRKKAALQNPIAQSGRGSQFEVLELLYVIRQVIDLLDLRHEHDLLDVGCGNGLVDIVLSAWCSQILAVEPVDELVKLARENLNDCPNVRVELGHGGSIPSEDNRFDRVILLGVMQLIPPEEVKDVFREISRVTRSGGRVVVGSVPNGLHREAVLKPYLEGVRAASHLSEDQKAEIVERNLNAHWYEPDELVRGWREIGGRARVFSLLASDPNADHRYHLAVSL